MLKRMIFSEAYGARAFEAFTEAMGDKIKKIKEVRDNETGRRIATEVFYEDNENETLA